MYLYENLDDEFALSCAYLDSVDWLPRFTFPLPEVQDQERRINALKQAIERYKLKNKAEK